MTTEVDVFGLKGFDDLVKRLSQSVDPAARVAINDGARFAVREGAKDISSELNLSQRYIMGGPAPRLLVRRFASDSDLEAVVTGRDRPTSLSRFSRSAVRFGHQRLSPTVKVSAQGGGQRIRGSFFVRLRRGINLDGENFNVGLAVRLKPGQRIPGKNTMAKPGRNGFYLLYGPSVGQAYRTASVRTVPAVEKRISNTLARELSRRTKR